METAAIVVLVGLFFAGFVLVCLGVVGKELPGLWPARPSDPEHPGPDHPPERHKVRLLLTGLGLIVIAIGLLATVAS